MLSSSYQTVLEARTQDRFRSEIVRFALEQGFDTIAATLVIDHCIGGREVFVTDNTPAAYVDAFNDASMGKLDPVMQHCKHQNVPIIWNQSTYVKAGLGELWEEQAHYGLCNGVAVALHMPEGRHFVLGMDRRQALPATPEAITRIVADLQLFAVHAQEAAWDVHQPLRAAESLRKPKLTPRELECLSWTMEGKTAWEVGTILGISERTAVLHLNNAMHKLGCNNKHQAVLKALRQGYIR